MGLLSTKPLFTKLTNQWEKIQIQRELGKALDPLLSFEELKEKLGEYVDALLHLLWNDEETNHQLFFQLVMCQGLIFIDLSKIEKINNEITPKMYTKQFNTVMQYLQDQPKDSLEYAVIALALGRVTSLNLFKNNLIELPREIGYFVYLKHLNLKYNKLKIFPESICKLVNLEDLDLSHNKLQNLPKNIGDLMKLRVLSLRGNKLKILPESFYKLVNLEHLSLQANQLKTVSQSIGDLVKIETLDLSINKLRALPESVGKLEKLNTLFLFRNKLKNIPENILKIVNLKRLVLPKRLEMKEGGKPKKLVLPSESRAEYW